MKTSREAYSAKYTSQLVRENENIFGEVMFFRLKLLLFEVYLH